MRILLMETNPGDGDGIARELTSSGHEVSRCHDPGEAPFPCHALVDGEDCPLDHEDVQAAVLVRGAGGPAGRSAGEDGVRCALRRQIPVVLAGEAEGSTYRDWAVSTVPQSEQVVGEVEAAAAAPLVRHQEAALRSLRAVLMQHDLDATRAAATVHRDGSDIVVSLRTGLELEKQVAEMCSVRAMGAVRDLDPFSRKINVSIEP